MAVPGRPLVQLAARLWDTAHHRVGNFFGSSAHLQGELSHWLLRARWGGCTGLYRHEHTYRGCVEEERDDTEHERS